MSLVGWIKQRQTPADCSVSASSPGHTSEHYKAWVRKLATKEYADELVLVATARALGIEIQCVPYTPESSSTPWSITLYKPAEQTPAPRIIVGNNDVHYMWLAPAPPSHAAPQT